MKSYISSMLILCFFTTFFVGQTVFGWEPRLRHLRSYDVQKNRARLLETRECRGCFLRGAVLVDFDLRDVDIQNADLQGAIWVDGERCIIGSIGYCKKASKEGEPQ